MSEAVSLDGDFDQPTVLNMPGVGRGAQLNDGRDR